MRLLRWKQVDFANEAIKVGHSKTDHGAGRAVPLNKRAIDALTEWAKPFPDLTRLLEAGQPFAVVADIMGWSAANAMAALDQPKPAAETSNADPAPQTVH